MTPNGGNINLPSGPNLRNIGFRSCSVVSDGKFLANKTVFERSFGVPSKDLRHTKFFSKKFFIFCTISVSPRANLTAALEPPP